MRQIGVIEAILDSALALVRFSTKVEEEDVFRIFQRVALPKSGESLGITYVDIPKGRVRVTVAQENGLWLVETFNASRGTKKFVPRLTLYEKMRIAAEHGAMASDVELVDQSYEPSAEFDSAQSLSVNFSRRVRVGDLVAAWDEPL